MLKTFSKGGVHPEEVKISQTAPIELLPIPKVVSIPLSQHLGAPAVAVVKKGEAVKVGQLIAKSSSFISANIHSSVSGVVSKVDAVIDTSGYKRACILIEVDGDEWLESIDRSTEIKTEITMSPKEIIDRILDSGVVGLGGATFPTHVKLMVPEGKKAEVLIINGVECEPYLTSDHRLMLEKGEEILVGTQILMKGLQVKRAIIGIENNKKDAIDHLNRLAAKFEGIEIQPLKVKYPQGGEKQLIKAVLNREVPSGCLPIDVGTVVNNVGTAFAVYEAVQKNKPLFERVVTVTGQSVAQPANFLVRIGTPTKDLIDKAGGLPEDTNRIVSGGPMMGKALVSDEVSVVKGTSGILIMPEKVVKTSKETACIRCAKCASVCPMGLEPYLLVNMGKRRLWEDLEKEKIMDCMECGSCHFVCPAGIRILDYIRVGKSETGKLIRSRK